MSTARVLMRIRRLLGDTGVFEVFSETVDGQTQVFELPGELYSSLNPLIVTVDNIPKVLNEDYTFDFRNGILVLDPAPLNGQVIQVRGTVYDYFDDADIAQFLADGFAYHVSNQDPIPVLDPLPGLTVLPVVEEPLVALMAVIEGAYARLVEASQEIDINVPDRVQIPRSERVRQLLETIPVLQDRYERLSLALGVGIFRIQVLNQRRVSLTTNRLVPIFREMEFNAPYSGFHPTVGPPGALITLDGFNLTSTTAVLFGGVAAQSFTVVSDTQILAVVPPGALTGQIGVTTPYGTVLSSAAFVVGQPPPQLLFGPRYLEIPVPPGV